MVSEDKVSPARVHPVETVFSCGVWTDHSPSEDSEQALDANHTTMQPPPSLVIESSHGPNEVSPHGATPEDLEAFLLSPSGPREGRLRTPPTVFGRGLERFRQALETHKGLQVSPMDQEAALRREPYEAALLELNAQFKARWLDFDRSVAMAGRSARPLAEGCDTPQPSPSPSGGASAPPSPSGAPLTTDELAAYFQSLGVTVALDTARVLVAGWEMPVDEGVEPRVRVQKLRKDMRVAVARSLRPSPRDVRTPSPSGGGYTVTPVGEAVGAVAITPRRSSKATPPSILSPVSNSLPSDGPLSPSRLAPIHTHRQPAVVAAASVGAATTADAAAAVVTSTQDSGAGSPSIWSPRVGKLLRPLGPSPHAIKEEEQEVDEVEDNPFGGGIEGLSIAEDAAAKDDEIGQEED